MQLRKLQRSKKASVFDIAFILMAVMGGAIILLVAGYVYPQITSKIKDSPIGENNASVSALDYTDTIVGRFDMLFLAVFMGLTISTFISSFLISSSKIFVPVYIISLGLLLIFAVVVENVYDGFAQNDTFKTIAAAKPITNYIMTHLILITIGIGIISMILIFAKPTSSGGPF